MKTIKFLSKTFKITMKVEASKEAMYDVILTINLTKYIKEFFYLNFEIDIKVLFFSKNLKFSIKIDL